MKKKAPDVKYDTPVKRSMPHLGWTSDLQVFWVCRLFNTGAPEYHGEKPRYRKQPIWSNGATCMLG